MSSDAPSRGPTATSAPAPVDRTAGRYLLAIHRLSDADGGRIATRELRRALDVSPASVTEMFGKLDARGLVDYEKYRGGTLTSRGHAVATRLAWQFCIVTNFFESTLGADLDDETAYEISYVLPDEGLDRLRDLTGHPCIDACPETTQGYAGCHI